MNNIASHVDLCDPVESYVRPIRSVLFVDDQFPTFGQSPPYEAEETERARALWQVCTERGWLCDVDNSPDWSSEERQRRLAACDLLVLDFHLDGDNSTPALEMIRYLALSATPNMVVVYTRDQDLDDVLLKAASWARGVQDDALSIEMPEDLEELEDLVEWSIPALIAYLSNEPGWRAFLEETCNEKDLRIPEESECVALFERRLRDAYKAESADDVRSIERIGYDDHRWFQCGNLFLVVVGKPTEQEPAIEAESLLGGLESAVRKWGPSWLTCLVADSRRQVEAGSFRDDARLPEEALQKGLLGYISGSDDEPERLRRSTEIASHLLSMRFDDAATALGGRLLTKATSAGTPHLDETAALHLNAYLCSEPFHHHHLRVGTIFAEQDSDLQYWVCVTPACDMVPRKPNEQLNPWAAHLDPFRPMLALRLKLVTGESKIRKALKDAHVGRSLFFWNRTRDVECPVVTACFQSTSDPNPMLEQMISFDRARVSKTERVRLYRCVRKPDEGDEAGLTLREVECIPVAQLRPPYAERVVHVVGGHVSRIGVDFVRPSS